MTGFIVFWILSLITSIGMSIAQAMKMMKDVADQGYKLDFDRMSEFIQQFDLPLKKYTKLSYFIPGINMLYQMYLSANYNQKKGMMIDQFHVLNMIHPFTKEEQERYLAHPTGFNSVIISMGANPPEPTDLETGTLSYTINGVESKISFLFCKEDVKIFRVEGDAAKLSEKQQLELILQAAQHTEECLDAIDVQAIGRQILDTHSYTIEIPKDKMDAIFSETGLTLTRDQQIHLLQEEKAKLTFYQGEILKKPKIKNKKLP